MTNGNGGRGRGKKRRGRDNCDIEVFCTDVEFNTRIDVF